MRSLAVTVFGLLFDWWLAGDVYALVSRPPFGLLFQELLAPVLVLSRRNPLLACSQFAKCPQAFKLNCWPNMSASSRRCSSMNLLMFICAVCIFAYPFYPTLTRSVARGQHLPPHTEYQHPSLSPQLFHQADIAQE